MFWDGFSTLSVFHLLIFSFLFSFSLSVPLSILVFTGFSVWVGDQQYLLLWRGLSPAVKFNCYHFLQTKCYYWSIGSLAVMGESPAVLFEIGSPVFISFFSLPILNNLFSLSIICFLYNSFFLKFTYFPFVSLLSSFCPTFYYSVYILVFSSIPSFYDSSVKI